MKPLNTIDFTAEILRALSEFLDSTMIKNYKIFSDYDVTAVQDAVIYLTEGPVQPENGDNVAYFAKVAEVLKVVVIEQLRHLSQTGKLLSASIRSFDSNYDLGNVNYVNIREDRLELGRENEAGNSLTVVKYSEITNVHIMQDKVMLTAYPNVICFTSKEMFRYE